jgi:hypothetical protein
MEPATHDDIWLNYLKFRRFLWQSVAAEAVSGATPCRYEPNEIAEADGPEWWPDADEMAWNLRYAALMARVHYLRVPKPLPKVGDVEAMARYWDTHYNRNPNAGTPEEFVGAWHRNGLTALWS